MTRVVFTAFVTSLRERSWWFVVTIVVSDFIVVVLGWLHRIHLPSKPPPWALPDFSPAHEPNFQWGDLDGPTVCKKLVDCYRKVVHWKRNSFDLLSNHCGRVFTSELTRLFNAFAEGSSMELISLTTAMLFPILILQKPNGKLQSKVVHAYIQWCLDLLAAGDFDPLMIDGHTIQSRLSFHVKPNHSRLSRTYTHLMFSGRVRAALHLLSNTVTIVKLLSLDNVLPSGKSVQEVLQEKHPTNCPVAARAVLPSNSLSVDTPIIFWRNWCNINFKDGSQVYRCSWPFWSSCLWTEMTAFIFGGNL